MPALAFEDFVPGAVTTYGAYKVTREEIIAFASRFDPQPMCGGRQEEIDRRAEKLQRPKAG